MRILRIIATADLKTGGPIEGVRRYFDPLRALGIEQDVATLDPPDAPWVASADFSVIPLGSRDMGGGQRALFNRFGFTPGVVPWLRAHARDYDVATVEGLWNYATLAARRALVGGPLPYVVFTHGMLDPWFTKTYPLKGLAKQAIWPFNEGPLLAGAAAVLFTTEAERLKARTAFRPYRAVERVVGFGTTDVSGDPGRQVAAFRAALPALGDRRYLLFLSRIQEKKGCDLLVEAFARFADRHPDLDLVMAGPDQGMRAGLERRAAELGIASRIHWPGMIRDDVKLGAFHGCEAFVLPSHQENFGVVLAEAMACGRPVLTTDKVDLWHEIAAAEAGLIAADDVPGISSLLERFLAMSTDQRRALGDRARALFVANYKIESAAEKLAAVLHEAARLNWRRAALQRRVPSLWYSDRPEE